MAEQPLIDERIALRAAALVAPVRRTDPAEVAALRAAIATELPELDAAARRWSLLGADLDPTQVRVVGRLGWVRANLASMQGAFAPLAARLGDKRPASAAKVLGVQLGAVLGLLSTKVLGQFVLPLQGAGTGQLVVVGPNVLALGAEYGERADDIRRTIVLHEITHRLQFDAVPWLAEHLRGLVGGYLESARFDADTLREAAGRLPGALRRLIATGDAQSLIDAVLNEEQRAVIAEAQGLMSLLEGHGNAAMYGATADVIEDAAGVRAALERRKPDMTTRVLTVVTGLEMKKRQYRDGEAFVTHVVDRIGVAGLNRAFAAPDKLPSLDEIAAPDAWIARTE